jgi:uncharacterized cupredoxin-like copper-binding protein
MLRTMRISPGRRHGNYRAVGGQALIAGLVLCASAHAQSIDWSKAQPVAVELVDDRFVPDKLTFQHGVPYRLHLENHGKELHEFTAPEFFAEALVRDPSALANAGQEVVVQSGASADVFFVPQRPGTYRLTCADHDWDGMVGEIKVE